MSFSILLAVGNAVPALWVKLPRLEATALDGGRLVLPDSVAASITLVGFGYQRLSPGATIIRNQLTILQPANCNLQTDLTPLDPLGKKVMTLRVGLNDLSHLPPGIYFVSALPRITKLILAH